MAGAKRGARSAKQDGKARADEAGSGDAGDEVARLNLVVVRGTCSGPPELRELESGRRLAAVSVRTPGPDGRTTSVPVTVWEPAAWVEDLTEGADLVVVGAVRRRFFRTGAGGAAARVDVEAVYIGRAARRAQLEVAMRRAMAQLDGLLA